jgi:nitrate reductase alpha subunit
MARAGSFRAMIMQMLTDHRYRRLAWLALLLAMALITGCQNQDGGGGGY